MINKIKVWSPVCVSVLLIGVIVYWGVMTSTKVATLETQVQEDRQVIQQVVVFLQKAKVVNNETK